MRLWNASGSVCQKSEASDGSTWKHPRHVLQPCHDTHSRYRRRRSLQSSRLIGVDLKFRQKLNRDHATIALSPAHGHDSATTGTGVRSLRPRSVGGGESPHGRRPGRNVPWGADGDRNSRWLDEPSQRPVERVVCIVLHLSRAAHPTCCWSGLRRIGAGNLFHSRRWTIQGAAREHILESPARSRSRITVLSQHWI